MMVNQPISTTMLFLFIFAMKLLVSPLSAQTDSLSVELLELGNENGVWKYGLNLSGLPSSTPGFTEYAIQVKTNDSISPPTLFEVANGPELKVEFLPTLKVWEISVKQPSGSLEMGLSGIIGVIDNLDAKAAPTPVIKSVDFKINSAPEFKVWPNPASNWVHVFCAGFSKGNLQLIAPSGDILWEEKREYHTSGDLNSIDLGLIPSGLYYLRFQAGSGIQFQPLLITD